MTRSTTAEEPTMIIPAVLPDRLAQLDQIELDHGSHKSSDDGLCAMEAVAWLAGLGHTDAPRCASPVLTIFTIGLNDNWDSGQRQKLKPYLPLMVGTRGDGQDEARSYLALDWLIRSFTPAWLDLAGLGVEAAALRELRRIVDLVSAEAAGTAVRDARAKGAAARAAAGAAAGAAARDAARDVLRPTVTALQESALDLLSRMINPAAAESSAA